MDGHVWLSRKCRELKSDYSGRCGVDNVETIQNTSVGPTPFSGKTNLQIINAGNPSLIISFLCSLFLFLFLIPKDDKKNWRQKWFRLVCLSNKVEAKEVVEY